MIIKRVLAMFTVFVIVNNLDGTISKFSYEGASSDTVKTLQDERMALGRGISYGIVDKNTYAAMPESVLKSGAPVDPVKAQAILDAQDTTKTITTRFNALIKAIDLK